MEMNPEDILKVKKTLEAQEAIEDTCGKILVNLFELIINKKVGSMDPLMIVGSTLTLVVKNLERNFQDQNYEITFNEIVERVIEIDKSFSTNEAKEWLC